jgi:hypothetical protein
MRNKGLVALHKSKSQNCQTSSNKGKESKYMKRWQMKKHILLARDAQSQRNQWLKLEFHDPL